MCYGGKSNICGNTPFGYNDYGIGPCHPGGYATHVIVESVEKHVVKIPKSIDPTVATMLPCGALTPFAALKKAEYAVRKTIKTKGQAHMLIIGAGGLGLWCVNLAKVMFGKDIKITVADISKDKFDILKEYGVDDCVLWNKSYADDAAYLAEIDKTTKNGSLLFDAALDFVGHSNTVRVAHKCLGISACMVVVGLYGGHLDIQLVDLIRKELHLQGARAGSFSELKEMVAMLDGKDVKFPAVEMFKLENINEIHKALLEGTIKGRAILHFGN